MKKLLSFAILTFVLYFIQRTNSTGQSLNGISYQGIARSATGSLITNQPISLRFSILQGSVVGSLVYQETHSVTTNELGIFTLSIMQGTPTGTFNPLHWNVLASAGAYVKTEMDITGGTTYTDMGTTQLLSVPFALYAENSGSSIGAVTYSGTWDASSNLPNLASSTGVKGNYYVVTNSGSTMLDAVSEWQIGDWVIYNGTHWEKVDNSETLVSANEVSAIPTGGISATNVQDALEELNNTKTDKIVPSAAGNFASLNGTGNLTDSGKQPSDYLDKSNTSPYSPSSDYHPATKKYVDDSGTSLISSYIHRTDDGVYIYLPAGQLRKRFGVGDTTPASPLGIIGEPAQDDQMIAFKSFDGTQQWGMSLNPTSGDVPGLSFDETTSAGSNSRLFIEKTTGMLGIGTTNPSEKLQVENSDSAGITAIKILNTATTSNQGWVVGHLNDQFNEKDGAFTINESTISPPNTSLERMTIRAGGNVGINEVLPHATLHVNRPVSDPSSMVNLDLGSGITMFGQSEGQNLVVDNHQIQARTFDPMISSSVATASTLNLQPLGGDLTIHNSSTNAEKVVIKSDGRIGVGELLPAEKLHINGRIIVGDTETTTSGSSVTGKINNSASTTGSGSSDSRIGIEISATGLWSSNSVSKNIGIYVSEVSGQSSQESNIAAVLNGNVVIGDIVSTKVVGSGGRNVLAIQNGEEPSTTAGSSGLANDGIQIYSVSDVLGTSVFTLKNGNGEVIKLFRVPQLTTGDNSGISTTTYGSDEAAVINNLRTRLNELEARLQSLGLLH